MELKLSDLVEVIGSPVKIIVKSGVEIDIDKPKILRDMLKKGLIPNYAVKRMKSNGAIIMYNYDATTSSDNSYLEITVR